jgi:hypothetical protein
MPCDKRALQALAMMQKLYDATGGYLRWRTIDLIARTPDDIGALQFAQAQGWVEVAPGTHSVRLMAEGRQMLL